MTAAERNILLWYNSTMCDILHTHGILAHFLGLPKVRDWCWDKSDEYSDMVWYLIQK